MGRKPGAPQSVGVFWWFAAPFALLTLVFGVWPIVLAIQTSFTASATALQNQAQWVGWANYLSLQQDPVFLASLFRTLWYTALAVVSTIVLALLYALLLNSNLIGRGKLFFTVLSAVLIAELWHHVGFYVVIFWANLALCDKSQYEAAQIDGANARQAFWHVVLPQLRPAILVNSVYALIQYLKTFTVVAVMTKGGPNESTNFLSYYAYQLFDQGRYGEATAMATVLFALVLALAWLAMYLQGAQRGKV
jgi:ABC-type sugar transport system permease subunit